MLDETAGASNEIPDSGALQPWPLLPLAKVATKLRAGGTPPRSVPECWGGSIPFVKIEDITRSNGLISKTDECLTEAGLAQSSAWLVPPGALLLAMYASIGAVAVTGIECVTNQAIIAIITDTSIVDVWFLYFALRHRTPQLAALNIQTTQKNVNKGLVEAFQIPVPGLPEQRAVVQLLQTARAAIETRRRELDLERERKQALQTQLFTHGTERRATTRSDVGEYPESWPIVTVGSVVDHAQYGLSIAGQTSGSHPILRMNNLRDGHIDTSNLQYVELEDDTLEQFRLNKYDLLFNRTNSYDLVGKVALFNESGTFVFASYLVRLSPNPNRVDAEYLNQYLNWDYVKRRLRGMASRGVSQANVSASKLSSFRLPLPNLAEQRRIADVLSACDAKIGVLEREIASHQELLETLLDRIFSGHRPFMLAATAEPL